MDCATFLTDGFTKIAGNGVAQRAQAPDGGGGGGDAPKAPEKKAPAAAPEASSMWDAENIMPALRDTAVNQAKWLGRTAAGAAGAAGQGIADAVGAAGSALSPYAQSASDTVRDTAVDAYRGLGGELGFERKLRQYSPHILGGAAGALGGAGLGALQSYLSDDESSWKRALLYSLLGGGLGVGAGEGLQRAGVQTPNVAEYVADPIIRAERATRGPRRAVSRALGR